MLGGELCRNAEGLIGRFLGNKRGAIAVESAFIIPIYVVVFTLAFEAVTYIKLKQRSEQVVFAMADVVTSQTSDVDCEFLDNLGKLGWEMYRHGNWGSTVPAGNTGDAGQEEVPIWVLAATIQPDADGALNNATGAVNWHYKRANISAPIVSQNNTVSIPVQYYFPHEQLILVYGELRSTMPYNLFGLWGDEVFFKSKLKYMAPRNVKTIGLGGTNFTPNCNIDQAGT